MKLSQMKERMQQKLKAQQQQRDAALAASASVTQVFSTGEVVERTPVDTLRPTNSSLNKKKKKNK
jgi:hypothetical protein